MAKLIGFSGKIGTGKTTVCNILKDIIPNSEVASFATALRLEVEKLTDIPFFVQKDNKNDLAAKHCSRAGYRKLNQLIVGTELEGQLNNLTIRKLLQWWGTEYRRKINPRYWLEKFSEYYQSDKIYLIDDVRFPDEADFIISGGGLVYRLELKEAEYNDSHPTEIQMDNYQNFDNVFKVKFGELGKVADWFKK